MVASAGAGANDETSAASTKGRIQPIRVSVLSSGSPSLYSLYALSLVVPRPSAPPRPRSIGQNGSLGPFGASFPSSAARPASGALPLWRSSAGPSRPEAKGSKKVSQNVHNLLDNVLKSALVLAPSAPWRAREGPWAPGRGALAGPVTNHQPPSENRRFQGPLHAFPEAQESCGIIPPTETGLFQQPSGRWGG